MELTQALVRELLDCDYEAGTLTWRERPDDKRFNKQFAGKQAFTYTAKTGYKIGTIIRKVEYAHRIIFLHAHGYLPEEVDHENGNRTDNRISNLRPANRHINSRNHAKQRNNTSGITGVTWDKSRGKWKAEVLGKALGRFATKEEAAAAVESARIKDGGYTPRHGK